MAPGSVDTQAVRRRLLALDQALSRLEAHRGRGVEALSDPDELWIVERGLQVCSQCVLDVAAHLVASSGQDAPDYSSAIDGLGRLGIVPMDLANRLRPLAGFRNALVHGYLDLDVAIVHGVLNLHLRDVVEFARAIDEWLASKG